MELIKQTWFRALIGILVLAMAMYFVKPEHATTELTSKVYVEDDEVMNYVKAILSESEHFYVLGLDKESNILVLYTTETEDDIFCGFSNYLYNKYCE